MTASSDGGPVPPIGTTRQAGRRPRIRRTPISPPRIVTTRPALLLVLDDDTPSGPIPGLAARTPGLVATLLNEPRRLAQVAVLGVLTFLIGGAAVAVFEPRGETPAATREAVPPVSTTTLNAHVFVGTPRAVRSEPAPFVREIDVNNLPAAPSRRLVSATPARGPR